MVFFYIPGINTLNKSLSEGIKYLLGTEIGSGINNCLSSINDYLFDFSGHLSSYMVDPKSSFSQEFIDFNNNISLLSSLGLNTLSTTLGTGAIVYVYDRIINRPATRLYVYEEEIRDRFAHLWNQFRTAWPQGPILDPLVDFDLFDRILRREYWMRYYNTEWGSYDFSFFAEPLHLLQGNVVAWSSFRRYLEYSDLYVIPYEPFRREFEDRWFYDLESVYSDWGVDSERVFSDLELDIGYIVDSTSFRIGSLYQVANQLGHTLNTYDITVNSPHGESPLTITNPESILTGAPVESVRETLHRLDQDFRRFNRDIARNLAELYHWEEVIRYSPAFTHYFGSLAEQRRYTIGRRADLHRFYRLLVVYRVFPDLARRYAYFDLLDL